MRETQTYRWGLYGLSALIGVGLVTGCSLTSQPAKVQATPPTPVAIEKVALTDVSMGQTYLGQVTPSIQTALAPAASGELAQLGVHVGQQVKAGQVLASLNPATLVPQQNQVAGASAALVSAQQQYNDALAMYHDNTSSAQQLAQAKSAVSEQLAAVNAAKVTVQKAKLQQQQTLQGTATTPQDASALQAVVSADEQAMTSGQQQLQVSQANLAILKQSLDTAQKEYGSMTAAQVQQASDTYQNALSLYQVWSQGGYVGQNPYASEVTADQTIYQNLSSSYNTLQQAQQQYNQGVESVAQAQSALTADAAQLASAQKNVADAAPPSSTSATATQAVLGVTSAQAALAQAEAQYNAAVTSLHMTEKIVADKTQAKQSLDNAANQVRQDQVSANTAQTTLQVDKQNGQIVSPISGVIQSVGAQVGQQVGPQTSLVTIASSSPQMATIDVPESDIGKMSIGGTVNVNVPSVDETLSGTIRDVHPVLNQNSNEYPVDVVIRGTHANLLPGMQVEAQLANTAMARVISVPADAVLSLQSGAEEVFVESHGVVHSRIVQVGAMSSTAYQITDGLQVGEEIVVQGQNLLSDGDPVHVVPALKGTVG